MAKKIDTAAIRELNDKFRRHGQGRGRTMITRGILGEGDDFVDEVMNGVRNFDNFSTDNDPYSEHDFGALTVGRHKIFWKFEYYDPSLTAGSENPADEAKTCRIMTVMLAEEY